MAKVHKSFFYSTSRENLYLTVLHNIHNSFMFHRKGEKYFQINIGHVLEKNMQEIEYILWIKQYIKYFKIVYKKC